MATELEIPLKSGASLTLFSANPKFLLEDLEASIHNEAIHQIFEGLSYDFEFSDHSLKFASHPLVKPHASKPYLGRIEPNIFVGSLRLEVLCQDETHFDWVELEVRSAKTSYRDDYRTMLEDITDYCADLLLQVDSPVTQSLEPDFDADADTLYQRFTFLKSILDTDEFREAIQRIVIYPVTKWNEYEEEIDVRRLKRISNRQVKNLVKGSNRAKLNESQALYQRGLHSIPQRISTYIKSDSVDTAENRFVKYALEYFLDFILKIKETADKRGFKKLALEADNLSNELEFHLSHELFKEVSNPQSLPISSPALQRKEGYREVLRVWLMIDFAAKLAWTGGDDVYKAGKKDVATLYEYWLFFKLLNLFSELFEIDSKEIQNLIESGDENLTLRLKQGRHIPLKGVYTKGRRKLNIQFSYNRTFKASSEQSSYPKKGSWTMTMRPDYTLSIWPQKSQDYSAEQAEKEETIVHIHFDAKYKINNWFDIIPKAQADENEIEKELNQEKEDNQKGNYKHADLLKMHAYKDAIRRTSGAYVLYPGEGSKEFRGFHEVQPGLGAFPIRPSKTNDGTEELKKFIRDVISHHENRLSQSELEAYNRYHIYKEKSDGDFANEEIPEYARDRDELLEDTKVIVGYVRSEEHLKFYQKNGIYNFRADEKSNRFVLESDLITAKFVALRYENKIHKLYRIKGNPEILSNSELTEMGYPNPSKEHYIVVHIEEDSVYGKIQPDFTKLPEYQAKFGDKNPSRSDKGAPFATTLKNLLFPH